MSLVDTECRTLITTPTYAVVSGSRTISITDSFTGIATPLNVVWGPDDLISFTPRSAPSIAIASMFGGQSVASSTELSNSTSSRLSGGVKAGISVGTIAGSFALIGGIGLVWIRYRRRKQKLTEEKPAVDVESELPGDSVLPVSTETELHGDTTVSELASPATCPEMEVPNKVHELPGSLPQPSDTETTGTGTPKSKPDDEL